MTDPRSDLLVPPAELAAAGELARRLQAELDRLLLGRPAFHRLVVAGILARGHILLEGVPGVGKTALIKALAEVLRLSFRRVQFTPDLMPSDILGAHILQQGADGRRVMELQPGPVFTHLLLADEINRASPKTQSALLEAMQERAVTLLGETRPLPDPFFVLASQNPIELEGTYPLPEAQLDRFQMKLLVEVPDADVLADIVAGRRRGEPPAPSWTMSAGELRRLFGVMDRIYLPAAVTRYLGRLVAASHPAHPSAPEPVRGFVRYGASPRAAIALAEVGRAWALLAGRPTVGFEDVRAVAAPVLRHRLILDYRARFEGVTADGVVQALLAAVEETGLPAEVEVARA